MSSIVVIFDLKLFFVTDRVTWVTVELPKMVQ